MVFAVSAAVGCVADDIDVVVHGVDVVNAVVVADVVVVVVAGIVTYCYCY